MYQKELCLLTNRPLRLLWCSSLLYFSYKLQMSASDPKRLLINKQRYFLDLVQFVVSLFHRIRDKLFKVEFLTNFTLVEEPDFQ